MKRQVSQLAHGSLIARADAKIIEYARCALPYPATILSLNLDPDSQRKLALAFPQATIVHKQMTDLSHQIPDQTIELIIGGVGMSRALEFDPFLEDIVRLLDTDGLFLFAVFDDESKVHLAAHERSEWIDELAVMEALEAQEAFEFTSHPEHVDFIKRHRWISG